MSLNVTDRLGLANHLFSFSLAVLLTAAIARADVPNACNSSDPDFLCMRLKYVVYEDENLKPVVPEASVEKNITAVNSIWGQCKIGFELDRYVETDPEGIGLSRDASSFDDLDAIRKAFSDDSSLLVVTARRWEHGGMLAESPANAWTKMPGSGSKIYGVVLEKRVASFPNLLAHELGHYLNLTHTDLKSPQKNELMNQVIDRDSKRLTENQCDTARSAIKHWWKSALRSPASIPSLNSRSETKNTPNSS